MNNRELGSYGERLAADFLKKRGYIILEHNFWCCYGEVDLIAKSNNFLVFIEVKLASHNFIAPQYKIDKHKQRKIKQVAQYYLALRDFDLDLRFDVVLINLQKNKPDIKLIKNAFWVKERI